MTDSMLGTPEERLAILERKVDAIQRREDNSGQLVKQLTDRIEKLVKLNAELQNDNGRMQAQLARQKRTKDARRNKG